MADSLGHVSTATVTSTVNVPAEAVTAAPYSPAASDKRGVTVSGVQTSGTAAADDGPKHVVSGSVGTFTSAHGATVTLDASGNYTYNPETYSGIEIGRASSREGV